MDYESVSHFPTVDLDNEVDKIRKLLMSFEANLAQVNIDYAGGHISLRDYSDKRKKIFSLADRMNLALEKKVKKNELIFITE